MEQEEQGKALDKINYLRFAAAFLFLNAAGGLYSGKRKKAILPESVEAAPVSEPAQDEVMAAHGCYEEEMQAPL